MTQIYDEPRFAHRGIMLDSSRHYIPVPLLKKHLDAVLYNKMNVFHWHIVDDQSFPYESSTFPRLSQAGAYSPRHIYTQRNVRDIIEFARVRGIRVIPEFDSPGHTYSWGLGHPELITVCWVNGTPGVAIYNRHGAREVMNPISEFTFDFLKNLFTEVKNVFPSKSIHLGMDEGLN